MTSRPEAPDDPRSRALGVIATIDDELQRTFDRVLDAAESVLEQSEQSKKAVADALTTAATEIFEAAAMRDIVGQRLEAIRTAVEVLADSSASGLQTKDDKAPKIEEKLEDGSASESGLLNGPQLPGAAKSQSEVDALFDKLD